MYDPGGVYTFRIQGELCHRIGSLPPASMDQPAFAQIYIFDANLKGDQADRADLSRS